MVSNARLDLPEPERPVTTMSFSRGISTVMFCRLWTRAPCTAIVVRAAARAVLTGLELIRRFSHIDERQFLHHDVAPLGEVNGSRCFDYEAAVGQVFTGRGDARNIEIPLEVIFDFRGRADFTGFL